MESHDPIRPERSWRFKKKNKLQCKKRKKFPFGLFPNGKKEVVESCYLPRPARSLHF